MVICTERFADLPNHDQWRLATPPACDDAAPLSPCCSEPVDHDSCSGCGEHLGEAECAYCGGEGTVEIEYGSQAGREEPRTRIVQCAECQGAGDEREPDERDDGFRYADEGHYAGEGRP